MRPKYRWKDKLKVDMHEKNLLERQMWDRHEWQTIVKQQPHMKWKKLKKICLGILLRVRILENFCVFAENEKLKIYFIVLDRF